MVGAGCLVADQRLDGPGDAVLQPPCQQQRQQRRAEQHEQAHEEVLPYPDLGRLGTQHEREPGLAFGRGNGALQPQRPIQEQAAGAGRVRTVGGEAGQRPAGRVAELGGEHGRLGIDAADQVVGESDVAGAQRHTGGVRQQVGDGARLAHHLALLAAYLVAGEHDRGDRECRPARDQREGEQPGTDGGR